MIASLIAGGTSTAASLYGNRKAAKAARDAIKAQQSAINQEKQNNASRYSSAMNTNYYDRADSQAQLQKIKDYAQDRYAAADARQSVTNGTDAGTAMAKEANQQMVSGTMANIGTRAAAFRDNAANQYYNASNSLAEKEGNLKSAAANARAQNIANATQAVGQIAANVQQADAGGLFGKSSLGQKFSAWKNKGSQSSSVSLEPAPSNVPMVNKEDPDEDPNHVPFNYTLI